MGRASARQGLVYSRAWGPGSEVVEDVVDWAFVESTLQTDRPVVMTTSHPRESLSDAMTFFLDDAKPASSYQEECSAWLLVEVGRAGSASGARELLASKLALRS